MDAPTIDGLSDQDALQLIARLVNQANDNGDLAICHQAQALADALQERGVPPGALAVLDYFRANAWDCRYQKRLRDRAQVWDWEQPEVRHQVYLLRRALISPAFDTLHSTYRCQILTNLANQLDKLGRFVEAQALWSRALAIESNFWMARANRGNGLMHYAQALYDVGHKHVLTLYAHRDLADAVDLIARHPEFGEIHLAARFDQQAQRIAQAVDLDAIRTSHDPDGWSLGDTAEERSYRRWCLDNILFLNPLNDVAARSIAARDVLGLPSFATELDEPPIVVGMANELKQGYASGRWLLWEGTQGGSVHFSDRGVLLYNTLDYPSYGLSVEKVKLAYRIAYSTLDKIAYFLNHYLALGIPETKVSFRKIWREQEGGSIRECFAESENWPWRGLFWLSKDLFDEEMRDTIEPDARAFAEVRNHLEHKYVKVHEMGPPSRKTGDPFHDTLAYAIARTDLERRTLRLFQLVRAGLIYLLLGMHREELSRRKGKAGLTAPMILDEWSDDWKL